MLGGISARLRRIDGRQWLLAGGFVVAMAVAIGLGLFVKQFATAQFSGVRDCSSNSIDNKPLNGGCGALSPEEFIEDLHDNDPNDLQTIYADPRLGGLAPDKYERFADTAKMGIAHKNGNVEVDGRIVMTDARSVGRETFEGQRDPIVIGGKTYYHSATSDSFIPDSIPVMVMFDDKGVAEVVVLTACGNPMMGKKVVPQFDCKTLNVNPVEGQKDTYDFSTDVIAAGGATVQKVEYDFGDGSPIVTEENPDTVVRHTYTAPGSYTAKATVHFNLPGGKTAVVPPTKCAVTIVVAQPKAPPKPTPPVLPKVGAGNVVGLFAGTSAVGVVSHGIYRRIHYRRGKR